jgi:hypothetical protein
MLGDEDVPPVTTDPLMQNPTPGTPAPLVAGVPLDANPTAIWQGTVAARRELNSQRGELQTQRRRVSEQLQNPRIEGPDRQGLERQIIDIDARIMTLDKQISAANERVAQAALVPGAAVEPRRESDEVPEAVFVLSGIFFVVVLFPLSVAFALRLVRRGARGVAALPHDIMERFNERFNRIDQAVEAMAVEVERIGEGQRFVTRLMSDRVAAPELPSGRTPGT